MLETDEDEFWRLQTAISRVEAIIANGALGGDKTANGMLLAFTENAKKRIDQIEHGDPALIDNEKRNKDAHNAVVVGYLVQKETALNATEREQYGEFLSREHFTKDDFGSLETFYANAWDKLSEGGKAQMSHRVWEGVRQDQYQFSELPDTVKDKEAQRIRDMFSGLKQMPPEMANIPVTDRDDFVGAWDSGRKTEAYSVLDRPSFKENVAVTAREVGEASAVESSKMDTKAITASEDKSVQKETVQNAGSLDFSGVDISIGTADSKAISPARLSEPKADKKAELGGS